MTVKLVPELNVDNLERALAFYVGLAGFRIRYQRPEDRFAYIEREGAELMMEETFGPGRRWHPAPLEHPYGRGINFQIEITNVTELYTRLREADCPFVLDLEEKRYRVGDRSEGQRQFVVVDPDGYLLRFCEAID